MLNAILDGKRVCSLDIKNRYKVKDYIIEKNLRDAGRDNKLLCEDCGALLYLKSGEVKIPHFAHKDRPRSCESYKRDVLESESHRMGVHTLYNYLKDSYMDAMVEVDYKFKNNRRANVYIESNGSKLAVEYVYKVMDYKSWIERNEDYIELGINSVWILSEVELKKQEKNGYDFFQKTIHMYTSDGIIRFFDYEKDEVTFLKYLEYIVEGDVYKRSFFSKKYNALELEASLIEVFSTEEFIELYNIEKERFDKVTKLEYDKKIALDRVLELEGEKLKELVKKEKELKEEEIRKKIDNEKKYFKTEDDYCEEALKCRDENPDGPWYDSRRTDRWAICTECGSFTNKWWQINSKNECRCDCDKE